MYKRKRTGINQSYFHYLIFAETPPIASRSSAIAELPLERIKPVRRHLSVEGVWLGTRSGRREQSAWRQRLGKDEALGRS